MLGPGTLKHRVTIRRAARVKSATGVVSEAFVDLAVDVPARIVPTIGSRRRLEIGTSESATHQAFFNPTSDVSSGDRIVWRGATFAVLGVGDFDGHHLEAALIAATV